MALSPESTPAPGRNVVLVPFHSAIEPMTDECLRGVERLGIPVERQPGCSAIDLARCQMASWALVEGYDACLFVDADMMFDPGWAAYVFARPEPIVAGLYVQKGFTRVLNARLGDVTEVPYGDQGTDFVVPGAAAGFLRIRCEALRRMIDALAMPCCTFQGGRFWPFFLPRVQQEANLEWGYCSEDYAFCERAALAGIPTIVDTRIELGHIGKYVYWWDDATRAEPARTRGGVLPHRPRGHRETSR